jgi:hypothetical protein
LWLSADNCFAALTEKQPRCPPQHRELEDAIRRYLDISNNRHPKPFDWTKPADQILESVNRFRKCI